MAETDLQAILVQERDRLPNARWAAVFLFASLLLGLFGAGLASLFGLAFAIVHAPVPIPRWLRIAILVGAVSLMMLNTALRW
jgi:hypothetical protein